MQIGRYTVLEELGSGGFATVYRVQDTVLAREVALKVMRPLLLSDPTFVERFKREAQVMANLDHPHIIPIYDYGEFEDRLCLVMKLMGGGSASKLAEEGPLPWERVLTITEQVASALDYAHERGLVHRDVKPHNVLLDDQGRAALADFGLVRALEAGSITSSLSGGILGTPAYVPPEIWNAETATPATDVYALACVVFKMATGMALFDAPTPPATMALHFNPPQFPDEWPEGVPPGVEPVLAEALAREPADRYGSAGAFVEALGALAADPLAEPYAALEGAVAAERWNDAIALAERIMGQEPDYRDTRALLNRALEGSAAAERASWAAQWQAATEAALAAEAWEQALSAARKWQEFAPEDEGAAAAIARAQVKLSPPAATVAETPPSTPERPQARSTTPGGAGEAPQTPAGDTASEASQATPVPAPAGVPSKRLPRWALLLGAALLVGAVLVVALVVGVVRILIPPELQVETVLEGHVGWVNSAAFSPDGDLVVTAGADRTARIWETRGNLSAVLEGHGDAVASAAFSPDGTVVVTASWDNTARVWDASGNMSSIQYRHPADVTSAAVSPSGASVVTGSREGAARLWDRSGNLLAFLDGHAGPVNSVAFSPDGARVVTGSGDGTARLWDLSGDLLTIFEGHTGPVRSAAFSPGGDWVITGGCDEADSSGACTAGTMRIWEVSGDQVNVFEGHTASVNSVAFSPDGSRMVTGSDDNTARVWSRSGDVLYVLEGHAADVTSAAFSPDGEWVVTASEDGTAALWAVPPD